MPHSSQTVLVTGAAGNLGRAIVGLLAARGASVIAVDRMADALDAMLAAVEAPDRHLAAANVDLGDFAACERVVKSAVARYGHIDGVVHTVGGFAAAPIAESGTELWERMFRLNTITTVNVLQASIAAMRRTGRGSVVAIGAGAGLNAPSGLSAYAASKSAVLRLVESFAAELKPSGIRVNSILPGTIDTPQNRAAMPDADHSTWVTTRQLAEAVAFLISDAADGITGALLPVTGRG